LLGSLELSESSKVIFVVPDEKLYWVPWSALSLPDDSSGLSSDIAITNRVHSVFEKVAVLVSPSALLAPGEPIAVTGALAFGTSADVSIATVKAALPDMYATREPQALESLGWAPLEATEVEKALGDRMSVDLITLRKDSAESDQAAAIRKFFEKLNGSSIVHIAAHGIFDPNNAMESAIFLSSATEGVVRPADFARADLSKTSLVSLSACETGLSDVKVGGEAVGFVRGLLLAGAHRVLLMQWKAEDRSAREFFKDFYSQVAKSRDFVGSFRLSVLRAATRYQHPFYWGGFSMYGVLPN